MKKKLKIYKIFLDSDLGELWLDNDKQPIAYIHANDGDFRSEYHGFIIDTLGGELVELDATELLSEEEYDALYECDHMEAFYEHLQDKI